MLGRTGRDVGVVGLGAWQLGADWGDVERGRRARRAARRRRRAASPSSTPRTCTATGAASAWSGGCCRAAGRRPDRGHEDGPPGRAAARSTTRCDNFRAWNDRSRANLGVDTLDLVQLHCPPTPVYADDAVFDALDTLVDEGRIAAYGVCVETVRRGAHRDRAPERRDRADHPQRVPAQAARARCCPPRARPASASSPACRSPAGCCPASTTSTPRSPPTTTAPTTATARRSTSARPSPASPFEVGLDAVRDLRAVVARTARPWPSSRCAGSSTSPASRVVIPGARNAEQARGNVAAAALPPLTDEQLAAVRRRLRPATSAPHVHDRW